VKERERERLRRREINESVGEKERARERERMGIERVSRLGRGGSLSAKGCSKVYHLTQLTPSTRLTQVSWVYMST
jgi:hypothetical protein